MNSDASERPPEKTTIFDALAGMFSRWSYFASRPYLSFSSCEGNLAILCIESQIQLSLLLLFLFIIFIVTIIVIIIIIIIRVIVTLVSSLF